MIRTKPAHRTILMFLVCVWLGVASVVVIKELWSASGSGLTAEPTEVALSECVAGSVKHFRITVRNQASKPISLLGPGTSCNCLSTVSFPVRLDPKESHSIEFTMATPSSPAGEAFSQEILIYTTSPATPILPVVVRGTITPSGDDSPAIAYYPPLSHGG